MNRSMSIVIAVVAAGSLGVSLSSCNQPSCGMGTVQQQQSDGTLKCIPADTVAAETPCDVDAGMVKIVGGQCVPAVVCDPNSTTTSNGTCFGTGGGKPKCRQPAPGTSCIYGDILNFTDNAPSAAANLHVDLYDPIALLQQKPPIASVVLSGDTSGYVFQDFPPPSLGLIVVVTGRGDATNSLAATGARGLSSSGGDQYRVDAYAVKKSDTDAWAASGFDISAGGGVVAKFYKDAKPAANLLIANETMKAAGVTLTKDGADPGAKYFNDTLTAIDP
ncbi:MAG: hypothetical protein JWM53_5840, partial [bacterium]|nr:hypothetical protein [bacterium]